MAPRAFTGVNGKMARQGRIQGEGKEDSGGSSVSMLKRKRNGSPPESPVPSKKAAVEEPAPPVSATGEPQEVLPRYSQALAGDARVTKLMVGQPHASVATVLAAEEAVRLGKDGDATKTNVPPSVENLSHGQGRSFQSQRPAESSVLVPAASANNLSPVPPKVHIIPSHAGWFLWTKIHLLERQGLPDFFSGKSNVKTPEIYMQHRNFIINKYRENPQSLIKIEHVQELLPGDLTALRRVFEFLDHWGLVNYQVGMDVKSITEAPEGPFCVAEESFAGELQTPTQTKPPLTYLFQFDPPRANTPAPKLLSAPPVNASSMQVSNLAEALVSESLAAPAVEYHCNYCATDCSKRRYHCQKQADFDLCPDCYSNGIFGDGMASTDFIRMDAVSETAESNGGGWSDQETLLLLEALELYGDNWNEIAEHVATKSKAQCILHFIRLPIEDPFLEDMEVPTSGVAVQAPSSSSVLHTPGTPVPQKDAPADASNVSLTPNSTELKEELVSKVAKDASTSELKTEKEACTSLQKTDKGPTTSPQSTGKDSDKDLQKTEKNKSASQSTEGSKLEGSVIARGLLAVAEVADGCAGPEGLIAFADAGNPVMSQVAFLAAMVGPRVAAAAAQSALKTLSEEDPAAALSARNSFVLGPQEAKEGAFERLTTSKSVPTFEKENTEPTQVPDLVPSASPSIPDVPKDSETDTVGQEQNKSGEVELKNVEKVDDSCSGATIEDAPSMAKVRCAAATALASAAVKAKLLADQEEREIQRLVATVIENQLKKLEVKLKHFSELEVMLGKECEQVERARHKVYTERARIMASRIGSSTSSSQVQQSGSSSSAPYLKISSQTPPASVRPAVFTFGPTGVSAQMPPAKGTVTNVPLPSTPGDAQQPSVPPGLPRPVTGASLGNATKS